MARRDGPTMLVLTRQKLPVLDRAALGAAAGVRAGRLRAARPAGRQPAGDPDRHRLRGARGARRRQAAPGRPGPGAGRLDAVVGAVRGPAARRTATRCCRRRVRVRLGIEAASPFGWERWITDDGRHARHGGLRRLRAGRPAVPGVQVHPGARRGDGAARCSRGGPHDRHDQSAASAWASWARAPGTTTSPATWSTSGELARLIARRRAPGHDLQPDDLREGDRRQPAVRRRHPPAEPTQGRSAAGDLRGLAVADVRAACDAFRRLLPGDRRRRTGWSRSRCRPTLAHDTARHHPRGRAALARGRPAQRDDQDSRHAPRGSRRSPTASPPGSASTSRCSSRSSATAR